jgi:hypothetical protein
VAGEGEGSEWDARSDSGGEDGEWVVRTAAWERLRK